MMDIGGVTEDAIAQIIISHIDELCPGMCAHEEDGKLIFHTINGVAELHIDVKDPTQPLTIENVGILCKSCNLAKGESPWALFIYKRRACLLAWQAAIDNPHFRRSEQIAIPDV